MPPDHHPEVVLPDEFPATAERQILLVDDSLDDACLVTMAAESLPGIRVHHVRNAIQAHGFLRKRDLFCDAPTPDLVLLDLHMPLFDGASVLRFIRESFGLSSIPVVVLSGSADLEERMQCEMLGAPVIDKPQDWSMWRSRIAGLLRTHLRGWPPQGDVVVSEKPCIAGTGLRMVSSDS